MKSAGSMAGIVCGVGWIVLLVTPANQKTTNGYKSFIPLNYLVGKHLKHYGGIASLHFLETLMNSKLIKLFDVGGWCRKYAGKYI